MKNIFSEICPLSKYIFVIGFAAAILTVAASAVLYFGAGRAWDYYLCVPLCENLLALSRPVGVSTCVSSLAVEYRSKRRDKV